MLKKNNFTTKCLIKIGGVFVNWILDYNFNWWWWKHFYFVSFCIKRMKIKTRFNCIFVHEKTPSKPKPKKRTLNVFLSQISKIFSRIANKTGIQSVNTRKSQTSAQRIFLCSRQYIQESWDPLEMCIFNWYTVCMHRKGHNQLKQWKCFIRWDALSSTQIQLNSNKFNFPVIL